LKLAAYEKLLKNPTKAVNLFANYPLKRSNTAFVEIQDYEEAVHH